MTKQKNQILTFWQSTKTQVVTKFQNSNCDKLKKFNCDKNQKLKLWQNSKYQIVIKAVTLVIVTEVTVLVVTVVIGEISSNLYRASVCDMKKGPFLLISLSQILYYTLETTWYGMTKNILGKLPDHLWLQINTFIFEGCHTLTYFSKENLTPKHPMRCSRCSFLQFWLCFFF